ncbi:hypothetical protein JCM8547_001007 [Rhodosporidiobolus lusitaniae]
MPPIPNPPATTANPDALPSRNRSTRFSPHLPSPPVDEAPPGPFFDFESSTASRAQVPRRLIDLFHIVICTDLSSSVTPQLFYHFLLRAGAPRPLAIKRSLSGSIMIAYGDRTAAADVAARLDGQVLPLAKS